MMMRLGTNKLIGLKYGDIMFGDQFLQFKGRVNHTLATQNSPPLLGFTPKGGGGGFEISGNPIDS